MKTLLKLLLIILPWAIRRPLLTRFFGYQLHPTSCIQLAWVYPRRLVMEAHTTIRHLTVCVHLDSVHLHAYASIGRGNWITGFPTGTASKHFQHEVGRRAELIMQEHSAITNRHLIDATSTVSIGRFSTFAGFQSQILTHTVNLEHCRQSSAPVRLGDYCFVGTNCVLVGGSVLPDYSVLGAKSLLLEAFVDTHHLYGGVPAKPLRPLSANAAYFHRTKGFIE